MPSVPSIPSIWMALGLAAAAAGTGCETPAPAREYPVTGRVEALDPRFADIVPEGAVVEVLTQGHLWTEGPVWVPELGSVLYSDIPNNAIYRWAEGEEGSLWLQPAGYLGDDDRWRGSGPNGLLLDLDGRLLVAQHGQRQIARFTGDLGNPEPVFQGLASGYEGLRFNSPNDLVQARTGDLYFTDPPYGLPEGVDDPARELGFQGVYRLDPDGDVTLITNDLTRPNGIVLSPDQRTLYVANSDRAQPKIMAYPVRDDGSVGEGELFFESWGDGMTVDTAGNLYVAGPDDGVLVLSPEGEALGSILVGRGTANCTFGEDGSTLFITASEHLLRIRLSTVGAASPPA